MKKIPGIYPVTAKLQPQAEAWARFSWPSGFSWTILECLNPLARAVLVFSDYRPERPAGIEAITRDVWDQGEPFSGERNLQPLDGCSLIKNTRSAGVGGALRVFLKGVKLHCLGTAWRGHKNILPVEPLFA